ncbi:class B sortase [Clostridium sp. OF09-36]|nr:class B sortase [Clostridium sp. OF09-36]
MKPGGCLHIAGTAVRKQPRKRESEGDNMNVRRWINRVSKVVFFGALVVAALDFASLYRFESNIDEVWQTAYRTEVPRKESVAKTSDFDLAALQAKNPDCIGYIRIPDTPLSYPVMQTEKDNGMYYLKYDFEHNPYSNGMPFLDIRCDIKKPSDNLIVYAHNTRNTKMFSTLRFYKDASYFTEHPDVIFDHAGGGGRYHIFAVLFTSLNEEENRKLFSYIDRDPEKPEGWEAFLTYLKKNRLYDTGVDVDSGDEILMLSTCYRQIEQGRALVFARKERAGEGQEVSQEAGVQEDTK